MSPRKIIIDTDPGIDDVLAMLLAFAATPEELDVLLLSVTYGNIDIQNCLRNVVSLFYHIEKEIRWRESQGREAGFAGLRRRKPLVAVGPSNPLADDKLMADYFHGSDGLGGIHNSHPHLSPDETWKALFSEEDAAISTIANEIPQHHALFEPSKLPAHQEILRLLRGNEADTITIVAIGPLTNLALAAAEDPETFLRAKDVVVMGGNLEKSGNVRFQPTPTPPPQADIPEPPHRLIKAAPGPIRNMLNFRNQMTPVAEFNTFADAYAAARVYALTSPNPRTTMPPVPPAPPGQTEGQHPPPYLEAYPEKLSRQLRVVLFPLDITERHRLTRGNFRTMIEPMLEAKSPLAEWMSAFMTSTFAKMESLQSNISGDAVPLQLHDPLTVWYCMCAEDAGWRLNENVDARVETAGQWTRGMYVVDKRSRKKREDDIAGEVAGDHGNWLSSRAGNRLAVCKESPEESAFGTFMLKRILSL